MIEMDLHRELEAVAQRCRRLRVWGGLALSWLVFAVIGGVVLWWSRNGGQQVTAAAPLLSLLAILAASVTVVVARRRRSNSAGLARRIERRFPELDARLLTAIGETSERRGRLGFLQQTVIGETLAHARRHSWETIVSERSLKLAKIAQATTLCGFIFVIGNLMLDGRAGNRSAGLPGPSLNLSASFKINVEPEDTSIERGTSLLVLARFDARLPAEVRLDYRKPGAETASLVMTKSLDDPVFAARVLAVDQDLTYAVHYDNEQTHWYKVTVFDYPELVRADARLAFPEYTKMAETVVEDVRSVTAVEGTKLTLVMRLNKPVAEARLLPSNAASQKTSDADAATTPNQDALLLSADATEPNTYTTSLVLTQSRRYRLHLVDNEGRKNKQPPEFAVNVTPNRPADIKLAAPARDVQVSPLEELVVKARVYDDYGLRRYGVSYSMAGAAPQEIVLGEAAPGKERRDIEHTITFETLKAEPDQLLSYYFWAEDAAPDGSVRRTSGDMFFAEVRPFEEIFRQGQQPAGGEQQMQQGQQGQNAQQTEQLANLQKQIINATWKLVRREAAQQPTDKFASDVQLLGESQASAKEQAAALGERLEDSRSKAYLDAVLNQMDRAMAELLRAKDGPVIEALGPALAAEQAAYQGLLKLRAREHEVIRGNRRQQQQGGGAGGNRSQQQLDQLELDESQNRYETQRSASSLRSPEQQAQERESRQVLNRLRELAQRQEDLNKQIKELQTALEEARDQSQQEEIRRQLARLRDRQQEVLRDTDELRDRMDRPENQERMADSRQQLDQTRSNVRRASEALEQGMVSEAAAAGTRAGEELNRLRDEFRQANAGQFNEAVDELRNEARELDENQKRLSERLTNLGQPNQRSLRETGDRRQIAEGLGQQKQELQKLLENMRRTIEEAETSEPLLSKQLYDTVRETRRQQPEQALDTSRQLLERTFVDEARSVEREAGRGISDLRKGVEQAAESVLGGDTEGLRRARRELESLAEDLNREISRGRQGGGPQGEQASADSQKTQGDSSTAGGQRQDGSPTDGPTNQQGDRSPQDGAPQGDSQQTDGQSPQQSGNRQGGTRQANTQKSGPKQTGEPQSGSQKSSDQQEGDQQAGQRSRKGYGSELDGGERPGDQKSQQQAGQPREGQQPGGQQGGNQQQGGLRQAGSRNGETRGGGPRDGGNGDRGLQRFLDGAAGPGDGNEGPLTGGNFRDWSDRLRDVEEMVGDPRLRAEAARIRDRATAMRADFKRHSKEPNWDLVQEFIGRPLVELRRAVADELLRRESSEALVPIDREPVPPEYVEQVRRYYERLGSGR